jgi:hypothetical protein
MLYAYGTLERTSLVSTKILEVRLRPRIDKAYRLGIEQVLEPTDRSPEADVLFWGKIQNSQAPFNGMLEVDGKENSVRNVYKPEPKGNPRALYIYYCRSGAEDDKGELEKICADFKKTLKAGGPRDFPLVARTLPRDHDLGSLSYRTSQSTTEAVRTLARR